MIEVTLVAHTPAEIGIVVQALQQLAAIQTEPDKRYLGESMARALNGEPPLEFNPPAEPAAEKPAKKRKPVETAEAVAISTPATPAPWSSEPAAAPATAPAAEELTLEAVRAKLAAISQAGKRAEVQTLLKDFGVAKLTDLPKDKYADVLEKAEAL